MSENIPHSLGGFRGAFESEHGRKPTEQEIWNAAIRSWRDITRQKSDAVKEQVVEDLLMYAGDNGYSHIDYADTMRHAAALLQSTALPAKASHTYSEQIVPLVKPTTTFEKMQALYLAASNLMAYLGRDGAIQSDGHAADTLMNCLHDLDGGEFNDQLFAAMPVGELTLPEKRDISEFDPNKACSTYFRGLGWNEAIDVVSKLLAAASTQPVREQG